MVRNQQKHSGNKHHDDCVAILWAVPNEHCMLLNLAGSENVNWHFRVPFTWEFIEWLTCCEEYH